MSESTPGNESQNVDKPAKVPARKGSQWATGQRKNQKGYSQPKGFARGARVK